MGKGAVRQCPLLGPLLGPLPDKHEKRPSVIFSSFVNRLPCFFT